MNGQQQRTLVGYKGLPTLQVGEQVWYKISNDTGFTPAIVVRQPGTTGVFVRLTGDYKGKNQSFSSGQEILAGAREVYR